VHYVVLYSSWLGIGLSRFWAHSLSPLQAVTGAALFVGAFVLMIAYIDPIRQFSRKKQQLALRLIRLWYHRRYRRWALREG